MQEKVRVSWWGVMPNHGAQRCQPDY